MTSLTDATFYAPVKTSLVLTNGSGNPTFSRATTKNVFDNEGKSITLKSGAVTLGGARCVQNWCVGKSEDITDSSWTKTGVTAPSANVMLSAATTSSKYIDNSITGASASPGDYWTATFRVQYVDIQYVQICGAAGVFESVQLCNFDLINGDYTATSCTATMTAVSAGVWDISINLSVTGVAGKPSIYFALVPSQTASRVQSFVGDGVKSVGILRFQLENVTGQADQTASEYVSVGVLASPYHGGGADGVKYFSTNKDGSAIPDANMRGAHTDPASKTNTLLWCRDFTNAAWVKTNVTATKNQIGITGQANSCSLLEFTADGATVLQTIVAAAAAGCSGYWVKWHTAVGTIEFTRDNITWLDITSELSAGAFYVAKVENTSVTSPVIGFRGMNGGKIIVDAGLNHLGTQLCEPIFTTSAAVTRNAEVLTYQTSGNFSDTAGTILTTFRPTYDTWPDGSIVGKASFGLLASASNSGVQAADGTNTVSGAAGTPSGQTTLGARWSGASLQAYVPQTFGAAGSYDGSFNLSTIVINSDAAGYIRDVAIWQESLTNNEMLTATGYVVPTDLTNLPNQKHQDVPFQYIDDVTSSATHSFFCEAPAGTDPAAAGWRISSYEYATGYTKYADGNTNYDNVADDRTTLTYSFTK